MVETVYRAFGCKAGLFGAVVEAALAGGSERAEVPVEERPAIRAMIAEPDPGSQVACTPRRSQGSIAGPVRCCARCARRARCRACARWSEIEAQREVAQARVVGLLASRGALRAGLGVEQGSDLIWTLCSLAVYDLLVVARGWTPEEYESWLADALIHELLG